jgi:hypothetical protein
VLTNIKIDIFMETYPDKLTEGNLNCTLEELGGVLRGTPYLKPYRLEGGALTYIVTDLINASTGHNYVNTVQQATIGEGFFSMLSTSSSSGTTGLCNPFLSNGSVNTLPPKQ